jgi:hypothetical protein
MSNKFCKFLTNGYTFNNTTNGLTVAPCCWWQGPQPHVSDNISVDRQLNFESIDSWTDNCKNCFDLEQANQHSLRQTSFSMIPADEKSRDPIAIDISLDSECNAACVICNASSSSLWRKENAKFYNIKFKPFNELVDNRIDQICSNVSLDRVRYVKFFGGEPLFTDTHLNFIKKIPNPDQVTLHYTTNGSIYPSKDTLKEWKKFKLIIFAVSIDGIEEQFNYLRWPLKWNKVTDNIHRIKNNKDIWNLMFRVEFTANILNTYYYDRLEKWVADNLAANREGDKTDLNIHQCFGSAWALESMPDAVRKLILAKYPQTHVIHNLVTNLSDQTSLAPWQNFVDIWDSRRDNSWEVAFPELVGLI